MFIIDPVAQFLEQHLYIGHLKDLYNMLDMYQALEMIIATKQICFKEYSSFLIIFFEIGDCHIILSIILTL